MKDLFLLCWLFSSVKCFSQDAQRTQLRFLINDSRNFFEQSIGAIKRISDQDTTYTVKTSLDGNLNGVISFRNGKSKWAIYSIYLLEDASFQEVKKAAQYWRNLVKSVTSSYTEEVNEGKRKNIHGKPQYEFIFTKIEPGKKNWVHVLYAKDKKSYYLYLSIGWQEWFD
jgi:hypothetical protein